MDPKTTMLAAALTIAPMSDAEIERACAREAARVWTKWDVMDTSGSTPDAQAAQWFMAGCRMGARKMRRQSKPLTD